MTRQGARFGIARRQDHLVIRHSRALIAGKQTGTADDYRATSLNDVVHGVSTRVSPRSGCSLWRPGSERGWRLCERDQ